MKVVKIDLQVDSVITTVAETHRRLSFSVRPKLEAELEKLEAVSWVFSVVIAPKRSSNEIRLTVVMREANKAILNSFLLTGPVQCKIHGELRPTNRRSKDTA